MHVSVYRSIMALLFQILVLVSIIESMPVKFVPTTEPHPMAGHYRDTPVRGVWLKLLPPFRRRG
ncbi:hypothetical protein Pst134EB_014096 [Puccinia striiformis f. sp. tritici]|nr:hypothetical protein Pst134EB_014096 [Puccinia striiformis f. sp. tritici]